MLRTPQRRLQPLVRRRRRVDDLDDVVFDFAVRGPAVRGEVAQRAEAEAGEGGGAGRCPHRHGEGECVDAHVQRQGRENLVAGLAPAVVGVEVHPGVEVARLAGGHLDGGGGAGCQRGEEDHAVLVVAVAEVVSIGAGAWHPVELGVNQAAEEESGDDDMPGAVVRGERRVERGGGGVGRIAPVKQLAVAEVEGAGDVPGEEGHVVLGRRREGLFPGRQLSLRDEVGAGRQVAELVFAVVVGRGLRLVLPIDLLQVDGPTGQRRLVGVILPIAVPIMPFDAADGTERRLLEREHPVLDLAVGGRASPRKLLDGADAEARVDLRPGLEVARHGSGDDDGGARHGNPGRDLVVGLEPVELEVYPNVEESWGADGGVDGERDLGGGAARPEVGL
ncbi:MAG: hypothetical protein BWZ02_02284 [Lentisphaerae bacterium ADurb.BinA184]|nr:MAG: hypothetical protein BWZ02_02284 [Lentisphaerae bacterium ADurb.BinA184]